MRPNELMHDWRSMPRRLGWPFTLPAGEEMSPSFPWGSRAVGKDGFHNHVPIIRPADWLSSWLAAGGKYKRRPAGASLGVELIRPVGGDDDEIERLAWLLEKAPNRHAILEHIRELEVEF